MTLNSSSDSPKEPEQEKGKEKEKGGKKKKKDKQDSGKDKGKRDSIDKEDKKNKKEKKRKAEESADDPFEGIEDDKDDEHDDGEDNVEGSEKPKKRPAAAGTANKTTKQKAKGRGGSAGKGKKKNGEGEETCSSIDEAKEDPAESVQEAVQRLSLGDIARLAEGESMSDIVEPLEDCSLGWNVFLHFSHHTGSHITPTKDMDQVQQILSCRQSLFLTLVSLPLETSAIEILTIDCLCFCFFTLVPG